MKKQLLALSCALTLGVGTAVASTTDGPSVKPLGQVAYVLASRKTSNEALRNGISAGGGAAGGYIGERVGRRVGNHLGSLRAAAVRTGPRIMLVRGAVAGARIGAIGGFAGLVIGAVAGAA